MRLFADTSFYIAVVNAGDASHHAALDIMECFRGRIVTTEYVLVECGNWLASVGDRENTFSCQRGLSAGQRLFFKSLEMQIWVVCRVVSCRSFLLVA
mgnify:CR=1 FL=1